MKSIDIINYIDSLNEDAYSKYTAEQLYIKLGHDRFVSYARSIMDVAIRRLNTDSPIKTTVPSTYKNGFEYHVKIGKFQEEVIVRVSPSSQKSQFSAFYLKYGYPVRHGSKNLNYRMYYIRPDDVNVSQSLSDIFTEVYNDHAQYRDPYIGGPTNKTKLADYDKYTCYQLFLGIPYPKLFPYVQECFKAALLKSDYEPIPGDYGNLRDEKVTVGYQRGRYAEYNIVSNKDGYQIEKVHLACRVNRGSSVDVAYYVKGKWVDSIYFSSSDLKKPVTELLTSMMNSVFNSTRTATSKKRLIDNI